MSLPILEETKKYHLRIRRTPKQSLLTVVNTFGVSAAILVFTAMNVSDDASDATRKVADRLRVRFRNRRRLPSFRQWMTFDRR